MRMKKVRASGASMLLEKLTKLEESVMTSFLHRLKMSLLKH